MKKGLLILLAFLSINYTLKAATATASSGNWTGAIWSGGGGSGGAPVAGDAIVIPTGVSVTINTDVSAIVYTSTLAINGTGTLTIASGGILSRTTGVITFGGSGAGKFIIAGLYITSSTVSPTFTNASGLLNIQSGGIIQISASAGVAFASASATNTQWDDGAILDYNVSGSSNFGTGATFFPGASAGTSPIFRISLATASASTNTHTINGKLDFNGTAVLPNYVLTIRDGITGTGTGTFGTGLVTISGTAAVFSGAGVVTLGSGGLKIADGATVTMTSNKAFSSSNTLTVGGGTSGILDCAGFVLSGTNVKFTLAAGATLKSSHASGLASNITTTGAKTFTAAANYEFDGATTTPFGALSINSPLNLTIAANVTLDKSLTYTGTVTLTSGTLTVGANTVTLSGGTPFSVGSGNIDASNASATITLSGSASQTIPNNTFKAATNVNSLTINNSSGVILSQAITVATTLTLTSGTFTNTSTLTMGASATVIRTAGSFSANPTYGAGTGVTYNGATLASAKELTPASGSIGTLTVNSSGTYTISNAVSVTNLTLTAGTCSNSTNNITLASGGLITRTAGILSAAPVFTTTVDITYSNGSTLTTDNEVPSTSTILRNLTISGSAVVTIKAAANPTMKGTLSLSGANLDLNANTLTMGTSPAISFATTKSITSTGSGVLAVTAACVISGGTTLTFASTVTITASSSINFGSGLSTISGTLQINQGGSVLTNAPAYSSGTLVYNQTSGSFPVSATEWPTSSGPTNVTVNANGGTGIDFGTNNIGARTIAGTLTLNNDINLNGSGSPSLTTLNTVANATATIKGAGTFTHSASGSFSTMHASGINGTVTTSGAPTLPATTTFVFNGSVSQATGTYLPATVAALTITNTAGGTSGVTITNSALTISGVTTLNSGALILPTANGNLVTFTGAISVPTSGGTLTGSSTSNIVTSASITGTSLNLTFTSGGAALNNWTCTPSTFGSSTPNGLNSVVSISGTLQLGLSNQTEIFTTASGGIIMLSGSTYDNNGNSSFGLVEGSGSFTLNSGSTFITAMTAGLTASGATGTIQVSGTRTFSGGANYTFNSSSAQAIGNAIDGTAGTGKTGPLTGTLTLNNTNATTGLTLNAGTTYKLGTGGVLSISANSFVTTGTAVFNSNAASDGTVNMLGGATMFISNASGVNGVFPAGYTGTLNLNNSSSNNTNFTFNGSVIQATGSLLPATVNNLSISNTLGSASPTADVNLSSSIIVNGAFTNTGRLGIGSNTLTLGGNITFTTNKLVPTSSSSIVINGSGTITGASPFTTGGVSVSGFTMNRAATTFTVNSALTVTGAFSLAAGVVSLGTTLTLSGNISFGSGTLTGGTNALIINGSGTLGGSLTATSSPLVLSTLTMNRTGVTLTLGSHVTVSTTTGVVLTLGNIALGSFNLTNITAGNNFGTGNSNSMIVATGSGQAILSFATGAATIRTFPIGDGTNYTPATLTFSANTVAGTVGAKVTASAHTQYQNSGVQTNYLTRYWSFTTSGLTNYTYTGTFTYVAGDINGTQTSIKLNRYNGSAWTEDAGSAAAANVLTSTTGLTQTTGALNANDFTGRLEIIPPSISYTALSNGILGTTRVVSGFATITSANTVNTTTGTKPRLYYKKSTDANTYVGNTSSDNGWKFVQTSGNTGNVYDFTIDYTIINGGSVALNDVIQYFVVAQDLATNPAVGINSGTFNTSNPFPTSVALTSTAFALTGTINSYTILNNITGNYNIPSGTYTSLTGASGLFNAINNGVVGANFTVTIDGDVTETGAVALNQWSESGAGGYTMTIQPNSTTVRTISGSISTAMITFNGADRVNIDGRFGGSGIYLNFINTYTTASTSVTAFTFQNGATNNTLQYCYIQSISGSNVAPVFFSTTTGVGNSNNTVDHCKVRAYNGSNVGNLCINSVGTVGNENITNSITNNELYDAGFRGINIASTGSSAWTISGNSIYSTINISYNTAAASLQGIRVQGGSGYTISGNYIGGNSINAGGTSPIFSSTAFEIVYTGISLAAGTSSTSTITGNVIQSLTLNSVPTAAVTVFQGIAVSSGLVTIGGSSAGLGNTIGSTSAGSITLSTGSSTFATIVNGISNAGTGNVLRNNTIQRITISNGSTGLTTFTGINNTGTPTSTPIVIGDNAITNNSITAGGAVFIGINTTAVSTVSSNTLSNLTHSGTGATAQLIGIQFSDATAVNTIQSNTISTLSTASTLAGDITSSITTNAALANVIGILYTGAGTGQLITGNTINGLRSTVTGTTNTNVIGIGIDASGTTGTISGNKMYDFTNTSTATTILPGIAGYRSYYGTMTIANNQISITNASNTNGVSIFGFYEGSSNSTNYFYNTVYIGGSAASGAARTSAIEMYYVTGTIIVANNNLFYNERTGGSGKHYTIYIPSSGSSTNYSTSSNKNVFINATAANLLNYLGTDKTLSAWQTSVSTGDANSNSYLSTAATNAIFTSTSTGDLSIVSGISRALVAKRGGAVTTTTDYAGTTRAATPSVGAFEYTATAGHWMGFTSTAALTTGNWSSGAVPTSSDDVIVPAFAINMPTVSTGTVTCNNFTINTSASATVSGGTLQIAGALTNSGSWSNTAGTVEYNGTTQNIAALTYFNLKNSTSSSTKTAAGAIAVNGALTISSGVTLDMSTSALTGAALTTSGTGTLNTQNTTSTPLPTGRTWTMSVVENSSSAQTVVAGTYVALDLTGGNRTLINGGTIIVSGTFTPGSGTYTTTGNTFNYSGATQTIAALGYNNLSLTTATGTVFPSGTVGVAGTFTPASITTATTGTIDFNNSTGGQTIPAFNYNNLTSSNSSNTNTLSGTVGVAGTFTPGSNSAAGSSTVSYNKTAGGQTIAAFAYNNLTLGNTSGTQTLGGNATVAAVLALSTNKLTTTGSYTVTLGTSGSITGAGWIVGNLAKQTANNASPTFTFPIGSDATNYTPVLVTFTGNNTSGSTGTLTASTTAGAHAQLASSGINTSKNVSRYWTITNSGISGFTSYAPTFTFVSGDIIGSAATGSFVVRKYNGSAWSTTTTGTLNSTSSQATGLTSFSDFACGESTGTPTVAVDPSSTSVCSPATNVTFTSSSSSTPTPTIAWERNSGSGFITVNGSIDGGVYSGFATGTLNISAATGLNGYIYRAVFTNINGSVNSASATLTVNAVQSGTVSGAQTLCNSGTPTDLTKSFSGGAGTATYQWVDNGSTNSNSGGTDIATNGTSATYTPITTSNGTKNYYLKVTYSGSGCGTVASSNAVAVTVNAVQSGTVSGAQTLCNSGTPTDLTKSFSGGAGTASYQWVDNGSTNSNSGGTDISSNGTSATYTPITTSNGTKNYYLKVTYSGSGCGTVASTNAVAVTVNAVQSGTVSGAQSLCNSGTPTDLAKSFSGGAGTASYQWYDNGSTNSNTGGTPISSNGTSATYTPVTTSNGTTYYYVEVTYTGTGCGTVASSNAVAVTVNAIQSGTASGAQALCNSGTPTDLTKSFSGGAGTASYQWYDNGSTNSNTGGTPISSNGTSATYTPITTSNGTKYYYVEVTYSGSGCGTVASSNAVAVTVNAIQSGTVSGTQTICKSSTPTDLTKSFSNGAGTASYQWYSNTSNSNSGGTLLGGETSATYTPVTTTSGVTYYYVTVAYSGSGCGTVASSNTAAVTVSPITWTGASSTDWSVAGNWCGGTPASGDNVVIANVGTLPTLVANTTVGNITLNGKLTLGGYDFTVNGAFSGSSSLVGSNTSNLILASSSSAGTVNFDQTTDASVGTTDGSNALWNLIHSGSGEVSIGSKLNVFNKFDNSGDSVRTGGYLVLRSTASNTAYVAANTAKISGLVTVERYVHATRRAWRLLTAPLTQNGTSCSATIQSNWQSEFGYTNTHGYGTNIYGPPYLAAGAPNGYDGWTNGNSVLAYNSNSGSTGGYVGITSTTGENMFSTATSAANKAYLLFVRGDKTVTATSSSSSPHTYVGTTLAAKGNLQTGTQSFDVSGYNGKFVMLGNPYASPVDMESVFNNAETVGLDGNVYTWDPNLGSPGVNAAVGGYCTFNSATWVPSGGSQSKYLQSGQGFFVVPNSGTAAVVFKESNKATSTWNNTNTTGAGNGLTDLFRVKLNFIKAEDGSKYLADGTLAVFKANFTKAVANEDGPKLKNGSENLSFKRNGSLLAIEGHPFINGADTLFVNFSGLKADSAYELQVEPANFDATVTSCKLVDHYLATETTMSLNSTTLYPFTVTASAAASSATNRFEFIFNGSGPLPNNGIAVKAAQKEKTVIVNWEATAENGVRNYNVEKSTNGKDFAKLNTQTAKNGSSNNSYNYTDMEPVQGSNYYRIKATDMNDNIRYSQTVKVDIGSKLNAGIAIYPNPSKGNNINLQLTNMDKGTYTARVINAAGQQLLSFNFTHGGGSATENHALTQTLAAGIYTLQLVNSKGDAVQQQLIVE